MDSLANLIGDRIRNIRKEKGLSQEELAFKASLHSTYIGQIERGEKNATLESIEKIASALNVTLEELFKFIQPAKGDDKNILINEIMDLIYTIKAEDQKNILEFLRLLIKWKNT